MKIEEAVNFIQGNNGRIFSLEFVKRSSGELRQMVCRTGVYAHVKGVGESYKPSEHSLIRVWDMQVHGYRTIPIEGIRQIKFDGVWQAVEHEVAV